MATKPAIGAQAACDLTDYGWIAFEKDADIQLIPASTVKTMTLYVARKWVTDEMLADTCTLTDADVVGGTSAGLMANDVVSWDDLFHAMMLPSANEAANCIARNVGQMILDTIGGTGTPLARFINHMAEVAAADFPRWQGAVFASASGLEGNSRMSARQLCELALRLDDYAVAVSGAYTRTLDIGGPAARTININHSVNPDGTVKFPEFIAAKTGTLAGSFMLANLVMLWDDHNGRHATSIMNVWPSAQRMVDARSVLDHVKTLDPAPPEIPPLPQPRPSPKLPVGTPHGYQVRVEGIMVPIHTVKVGVVGQLVTCWTAL